jgi:hypothetical protein
MPCTHRPFVVTARLRARKASLAARRRTLATARALPASGFSSSSGSSPALMTALATAVDQFNSLSTALAQARTGLVQELVEVRSITSLLKNASVL